MKIKYRVYTKSTKDSPWKFTGVIERDRATANRIWPKLIERLGYYDYKLEYCSYGIAIER